MTVTLASGVALDLPDLAAVEKAIKAHESDLRKLRRLRELVGEFAGPPTPAASAGDTKKAGA